MNPSSWTSRCILSGDPGLLVELLAAVTEEERRAFHGAVKLPLLRELVLHLEEVGEVRVGLDLHLQVHGLLAVVPERDVFAETRRPTDRCRTHERCEFT